MSSPTDAHRAHSGPTEAADPRPLRIGGFVPLSTVDRPGDLVATVFTQGCPWDCVYCHNPHLLNASAGQQDAPVWSEVLAFLETRVGLLDGVVFTGGEPTAQPSLASAMQAVRDLGFSVALHTGGPDPERLGRVLTLVDWIGFDVKAPFARYEPVTRIPGSGPHALESLRAVMAAQVPLEARTTIHPDLLDEDSLLRMAEELLREGVRDWVLQPYRPDGARQGLCAVTAGYPSPDLIERLSDGFASVTVR